MEKSKTAKGATISLAVLLIVIVLGMCFLVAFLQNYTDELKANAEIGNYIITEDGVWVDYIGDETDLVVPATFSLTDDEEEFVLYAKYKSTLTNHVSRIGLTDYTLEDVSGYYEDDNGNSVYEQKYKLTFYMRKLISGDDYTTVKVGSSIYCNRSGPTSVVLPDTVTTIGSSAFAGCHSLKSITIPDSVKTIENAAFYLCTQLTELHLPDSITYMSIQVCENSYILSKVNIPTSLSTLTYCAFANTSITEITIPSNIRYLNEGIFRDCSELVDVTFEEGITYIGSYVFKNCTSLKNITLPSTITTLQTGVFQGCTSLEYVEVSSTSIPKLGTDVFPETISAIYVVDELYDEYLTDENWSAYANKIIKISEKI